MSRQLHELFLASCGLFSRWGVSISRPGVNVEERTFQSPHVFIGNRDTIDLPLQDPQVSRRHAYLQVLPGGLYCFDLGSRDKMHWGAENRDSGWLRPGEGVRIGPYLLNLLPAEHGGWLAPAAWPCADPLTDRISEAGPYAPVVVEVCDGDVVVAKGKMNRVMGLVGRSPECLFHINSPGLSKFHCSLVRTPTGLWVVDLLSRKGTCLNGRRVRSGRIHEGDLVLVGKYTLRFKRAAWSAKGSGPLGEAAGAGPTNAQRRSRWPRPPRTRQRPLNRRG